MDEREFWQEIRRGLITIARAVAKRYGHNGLIIVLGMDVKEGERAPLAWAK